MLSISFDLSEHEPLPELPQLRLKLAILTSRFLELVEGAQDSVRTHGSSSSGPSTSIPRTEQATRTC